MEHRRSYNKPPVVMVNISDAKFENKSIRDMQQYIDDVQCQISGDSPVVSVDLGPAFRYSPIDNKGLHQVRINMVGLNGEAVILAGSVEPIADINVAGCDFAFVASPSETVQALEVWCAEPGNLPALVDWLAAIRLPDA